MPYINPDFEAYLASVGTEVSKLLEKELAPYEQLKHLEEELLHHSFSKEILTTGHEFDYKFTALRPGKRLRPFIAIHVGLGNGITDKDSLYEISKSPEILHNFTLVHDDIMDRDEERSKEPTVRKRWYDYLQGQVPEELRWHIADSMALDSGDRLGKLAYLPIARSKFSDAQKVKAMEELSKTAMDISRGQDLDMAYARMADDIISGRITEKEIYFMYKLKTGKLLELCMLFGLIFSNGSDEQKYHGSLWATKYLNLPFQIQDDFLENNIDGEKGKPIGGDIKEGKLTPLVIRTLKKGSKYAKPLLKALGNRDATSEEIQTAIASMHDSGTVKELRKFKDDLVERGKEEVGKMGLAHPYDTYLKDLTEYVGKRGH